MRAIRLALTPVALALAAGLAGAAPVGDGLKLTLDDPWSAWQTRLSVVSAPLRSVDGASPTAWSLAGVRLSSDRYFNIGRMGDGGGLRATSALLLGSPSVALGAPASQGSDLLHWHSMAPMGSELTPDLNASTYFGVGYSAWWHHAGVGVSADLGLLAQHAGNAANRPPPSSLDMTVRSFQLSPVFQLNLSYAF